MTKLILFMSQQVTFADFACLYNIWINYISDLFNKSFIFELCLLGPEELVH